MERWVTSGSGLPAGRGAEVRGGGGGWVGRGFPRPSWVAVQPC